MKFFAQIISILLQPMLIPTYGMFLFLNMPAYNLLPDSWNVYKIWIIFNTLLFTGILPTVPIIIMMRKGKISNLFISKKEQRTLPYLYSIGLYLCFAFLIYKMNLPLYMVGIIISSAIAILVLMVVNTQWKISAHLTTMGGFVGAFFGICFQYAINPIGWLILSVCIAGVLMWSRITLKAHTPMQTVAGLFLGIVSGFVPCLIL